MFRSLPHSPRAWMLAAALALSAPAAGAQTWVPMTSGAAPGTPAEVLLVEPLSGEQITVFDVVIHGYWTEDVVGPDMVTYQAIEVPGLGRIGEVGAPDLPALRVRLAIASGASVAVLTSVTPLGVVNVPNQRPYPWAKPAIDESIDPLEGPGPGDADGSAAVFTKNNMIYAGPASYPTSDGTSVALQELHFGSLPTVEFALYPIHWHTTTNVLEVPSRVRYEVLHTGVPSVAPVMTRDRARLAEALYLNWPAVEAFFPTDTLSLARRWLAVAPAALMSKLAPLAARRSAMGFEVSLLSIESTGGSCDGLRAAIDSWYQSGSPWADHYVLLVGDSDVLPLCKQLPSGLHGDALYASPGDGDENPELFVGRLSVDDGDDLRRQVDKILAYEFEPTPGGAYDRALLVAHEEGDYAATLAAVTAASYAVPPTFGLLDGNSPTATDAAVQSSINAGLGLVAYRGHGTAHSWADWNTAGQSFHKNEVLTLANGNTRPVVWSIGCNNSDLEHAAGSTVDSLGETWMEVPYRGAVAHYGATAGTERVANDGLTAALFEGLYDRDLVTHGQLLAYAQAAADDLLPSDNRWAYVLLGDPSMVVRRRAPAPLTLSVPAELDVCLPGGGGDCVFVATVTDASNQPVEGALVSAYKPAPPNGGPPELLVSVYTGPSGQATIPLGPTSIGVIETTTSDDDGNHAIGTIGLNFEAWADFGSALEGAVGAPMAAGTGDLSPGSEVVFELEQAQPNALAGAFLAIDLPANNPGIPFKCGTLKVFPSLLIEPLFMTSGLGTLAVPVDPWPALPPGTRVWIQWAVSDPGAPCGVALSNAIRGTQP